MEVARQCGLSLTAVATEAAVERLRDVKETCELLLDVLYKDSSSLSHLPVTRLLPVPSKALGM